MASKAYHSAYYEKHRETIKARAKAHYEANKERHLNLSRAYARANREDVVEQKRTWKEHNPEKIQAHNAINNAIRDGKLRKPERCEGCGAETPSRRLHGHHHNGYAAGHRLDVTWLCTECHGKEHRLAGGVA
jgi:hypothetical protein